MKVCFKSSFNNLIKSTFTNTNSFYKTNTKNFFLANWKRSSRHHEDFDSSKGNTEDLVYYKQMKEFIKETQGVPKFSQKWFDLRNKHHRILEEKRRESAEKFKESFDVQYLRMYLIIIPEQTDCYEIVSILNFYGIKFKALEDSPVSKNIIKQMIGVFSKVDHKKYAFPFLCFETSEDPTQYLDGFDNVVRFLTENNIIHDYKSHTPYEKDGVEFVKKFEICLENEMKRFSNKFSFYFKTTNFKEARYWYHAHKNSYVYRNRLFSRIYRLTKSIIKDLKFTFSMSKTKKQFLDQNELNIIEHIKTWKERLNNQPFHGGDVPDESDFKLYALIRKYQNCRLVNFLFKTLYNGHHKSIKSKEDHITFMKFDDWISRMFILCSRSPYYNIRDVGYNYNRYMSEEVNESSRINRPSNNNKEEEQNANIDLDLENNNKKPVEKKSIMGVFGNKVKRNKLNI